MKIKGKEIAIKQIICLAFYYGFARFLPQSYSPFLGKISKWVRYQLCRRIFKSCGTNVNVERKACFGTGRNIVIGNNSGIGVNAMIPNDTIIGDNVMMGPNCYILASNHKFDCLDTPMCEQGSYKTKQTIVESDVWIGRDVTMTPGRHIRKGTIVGACCLLCKDFPEYSIVGGNPSKLIRSRLDS